MLATIRRSVGFSPKKADDAALAESPSSSAVAFSSSSSSPIPDEIVARTGIAVHGYLVLESSKGVEKGRFPLRKSITTVGRLQHCDIRIYQETISRLHCQICVGEDGKTTLEVFNPRGVRINRRKLQGIASTSKECNNRYPLQESDLIEIFNHYFRLECPSLGEDVKSQQACKESFSRKPLRMSLLRATIDRNNVAPHTREEEEKRKEKAEAAEVGDVKSEHRSNPSSPADKKGPERNMGFPVEEKENIALKGRRSFVLSTPTRHTTHNGPWETEPRQNKVRRVSLSPVKDDLMSLGRKETFEEEDAAIVMMEEVEEVEAEPSKLLDVEGEEEIAHVDVTKERRPITPPQEEPPVQQVSARSSSPKKNRRRSSFFGRAGIFAGINLGFYPQERKEEEEQKEAESGMLNALLSPPGSPTKLPTQLTPEPRLDHYGMPRLPRSMSSPSGLHYTSPSKRRNISLRTATLLKAGQQVFEQQRLLSPPTSPTKSSSAASHLSLLARIPSPEKRAAAGEILLPESEDESDAEEEDEVDESLSFVVEDQDDKERKEKGKETVETAAKTRNGPRRSHGVMETRTKATLQSRTSMPGTLLSVSVVDGSDDKIVVEWQKEWRERKEAEVLGKRDKMQEDEFVELEAALFDAFDKVQDEDTDEEREVIDHNVLECEVESFAQDDEQKEVAVDMSIEGVEREENQDRCCSSTQEVPKLELAIAGSPSSGVYNVEKTSLVELSLADQTAKDGQQIEGVRTEDAVGRSLSTSIPQELKNTVPARTRRASEQPRRRSARRSSTVASKSGYGKGRKSEGEVAVASVPVELSVFATEKEAPGAETETTSTAIVPATSKISSKGRRSNVASEPSASNAILPEESGTAPLHSEDGSNYTVVEERDTPLMTAHSPDDSEERKEEALPLSQMRVVKSSHRKRSTATAATADLSSAKATKPSRAAKTAAAAAIVGETISLKARQASESPVKMSKMIRGSQKKRSNLPSSNERDDGVIWNDGTLLLKSDCLVLEPSSPIKRTKRAAKNVAEEKIKGTLTRKSSKANLLGGDLRLGRNSDGSKADATTSQTVARSARLHRRSPEEGSRSTHSEPVRTLRSRSAAKQ
ncbi:hypothetical protein CBS101457_003788 [Exobasidium rhododendri]|nr:hypothetical protein CBS101457_003788 [Exobasidium rhododendri]